MVSISPVSFQATPKVSTPKTKENAKEHKMASTPTKSGMNPLKAQLLALAMLGAATLNSCTYDKTLEDIKDAQEIVNVEPVKKDTTLLDKTNKMARTIGVIGKYDDLKNTMETFDFSDQDDNEYYYQPLVSTDDNIRMNHTIVHADHTGNDYKIRLKHQGDGVRFVRIDEKKDTVADKVFTLKNDTVMEFDKTGKSAKIYNAGKGAFIREDSDGNIMYFDRIGKNNSMPQPIIFSPWVEPWEDKNSNVDM